MPRRNRIDPFGDLHAVPERGMFTGNRGCLVDDRRRLVRHHRGDLWIVCLTAYRDWLSPLDQPRHWTPLFFLDDAVALAAGHRPCGLCRRADYLAYRSALGGIGAAEINRRLAVERLRRGRGLDRGADRIVWRADVDSLPVGSVVLVEGGPRLLTETSLLRFSFAGWVDPVDRPRSGSALVLTPPTSVEALRRGYRPVLHPTSLGH